MKKLIKHLAYGVWVGSSIIGLILILLSKATGNLDMATIGVLLSILAGGYVIFLIALAQVIDFIIDKVEKAKRRKQIINMHYLRVQIDALKNEVDRLQGVA